MYRVLKGGWSTGRGRVSGFHCKVGFRFFGVALIPVAAPFLSAEFGISRLRLVAGRLGVRPRVRAQKAI